MFTKIQIAKYAANYTVAAVAHRVIDNLITNNTDLESDDITTRVASGVGGWLVASRLERHTDNLVEKAAAKLAEIRDNRTAKEATV